MKHYTIVKLNEARKQPTEHDFHDKRIHSICTMARTILMKEESVMYTSALYKMHYIFISHACTAKCPWAVISVSRLPLLTTPPMNTTVFPLPNIVRVVGTQRTIRVHISNVEFFNKLFYPFYRGFILFLSSNIAPFCIQM